jgi:hypothetical protein
MTKRLVTQESGALKQLPITAALSSGHVYVVFANASNVGTVQIGGNAHGQLLLRDSADVERIRIVSNVIGDPIISGSNSDDTDYDFYIAAGAFFKSSVAAPVLISSATTGTAPLTVSSNTLVTNLNADRLDGKHASDFDLAGTAASAAAAALTSANSYTDDGISYIDSQLFVMQADIDTRATTSALTAATKGRVEVIRAVPPGTDFATRDVRVGGSSPAEAFLVWDFDPSAIEYMDFLCRLMNYSGGGLTFTLPWSSGATTGNCRWEIGIRRLTDDAEDVDGSHSYDFNVVDDTTASAAGELAYATITFTNGSDMDDWANGEFAIVRVRRNAQHANDTMNSNDAELHGLSGKET